MNNKIHNEMFNTILTIVEAEKEFFNILNEEKFEYIGEITITISQALNILKEKLLNRLTEDDFNSEPYIESIIYSFYNILKYIPDYILKAKNKIEFELIPLTEYFAAIYYARNIVVDEKNAAISPYKETLDNLISNKYIEKSIETGNWKYDLSIVVTGYNKLEYTKKCLKYIFKYYPRHLRTELILINHGSTDETKKYFEEVNPDKQLDIKINGGGLSCIDRIIEGRYSVFISNDVFVQHDSISNIYECISSNNDIAYVVPATPNVSNIQTIYADYNSEKELELFSYKNNKSDSARWELRTRLCNPLCITDNILLYKKKELGFLFNFPSPFFPDDTLSLLCRRNGYKMILAKDAYCYHCGSVTLKEDVNSSSAEAYLKGRKNFESRFGIDPWFKCAYAYHLFDQYDINKQGHVSILSVDGGLGGNGLKIKELLKEKNNNDVYLKYCLTDTLYYNDVRYLGDDVSVIDSYNTLLNETEKYDYIIIESIKLNKNDYWDLHKSLMKISNKDAVIILEICNDDVEYFQSYNCEFNKKIIDGGCNNDSFIILY